MYAREDLNYGNTNSNLNNLGFVVKNNGWTYYVGYAQGQTDGIYKTKGNKNKKIIDDYSLYLNKSGKYIYYLDVKGEDIVRIKTNGENKEIIVEDVDLEKFIIKNNWIYYFDEAKLYKIKTNGKQKQIILEKSIENYEIDGDWIYYSYKNDGKHVISKIRTNGEENTKIDNDVGKTFFIKGNYIYYIYENYNYENYEYNYELYKVKTNGKNKQKVTDMPKDIYVDSINFNGDEIYYLSNNEKSNLAIYKMNINKTNHIEITEIKGYYTYINILDNWIYYPDVNDEGNDEMFRIETNGEDKESLCK